MSKAETLPRAHEAEQYILGCLVVFPDRASEVIPRLSASDFFDPMHQQLFAKFREQYQRGAVDPALVGAELKQAGYIFELRDKAATTVHVPTEAAKIIEARRKRQGLGIIEIASEGFRNGQPFDSVINALLADGDDLLREASATKPRERFTYADLRRAFPRQNPTVIDGLCRQGETVNIIANSKAGKSWLANYFALCIVTWRRLFDRFETSQGKVLILDNELHASTIAHRIETVADALEIPTADYEYELDVWPLRGKLRGLADLEHELLKIEPGAYKAIIFDAMYRFCIDGVSENDNAAMAAFYNRIDRISAHTQAASFLIHHASKGSQSDKRVTDVGSGAGAQSRAADCHLILREHEEPGVMVLEAAVRSFAPVAPLPLRWNFPLWHPADDIDPTMLKGKQTASEQRQDERDQQGVTTVVDALHKGGPATARQLRAKTGFSRSRLERLLDKLESDGQITSTEIAVRGNATNEYRLAKTTE